MTSKHERAAKIAALNDELRKNPTNRHLGFITMTPGVAALPWVNVLAKLASLGPEDFPAGDDPYRERDFAAFEINDEKLYFKIDYFEKGSNLTAGAEHPENPETTERVLTVMLREEY